MTHCLTPLTVALALGASAIGCGQRQAQVTSAPAQTAQVSIQVRNTLNQSVNVYVNAGSSDTFLGQVSARSTVTLPVPGVSPGATVTLRAVTQDGAKTYTRDKAPLNRSFTFTLP